MPTTRYYAPGTVEIASRSVVVGPGYNPVDPPTNGSFVDGGPPQWADEDDFTYASLVNADDTANTAYTGIDPELADIDPDTVTAVQLGLRLSVNTSHPLSPSSGVFWAARPVLAGGGSAPVALGLFFELWGTSPVDYVQNLTVSDLVAIAGASVQTVDWTLYTTVDYSLNVFAVWLDVTTLDASPVTPVASESWTRIYPRDGASAARVFPPPRTGRLVGGHR